MGYVCQNQIIKGAAGAVRHFVLLALLGLTWFGSIAWGASLEDLDAILREAGSVKKFLKDPKLVDQYYKVAREYYGPDKFPRASYDAILDQLRDLGPKVPELNHRLWQTPAETWMGAPIRVENSFESHGREIMVQPWEDQLNSLAASLQDETPWTPDFEDSVRQRLDQELRVLHESPAYLSANKKKQNAMDAELFKKMRSDTDVKRWAKQVALRAFYRVLPELQDIHLPDLVLQRWESLVQQPDVIGGYAKGEVPAAVVSEAKRFFRPTSELLKDEKTFPRLMTTTNQGKKVEVGAIGPSVYEFKVLPRRFHGIFKGVRLEECVGGSCKSLKHLLAERWGTVAIEGAQIHYLERNGSYLGFTEAVPGNVGQDRYLSVSFGAPELKAPITTVDAQGSVTQRPLFSHWIRKMHEHLPPPGDPGVQGLVVSNTKDINNAGVLNDLMHSPEYILARSWRIPAHGFQVTDPMSEGFLAAVPPPRGQSYAGEWVIDAVATQSPDRPRGLRLLARSEKEIEERFMEFIREGYPMDTKVSSLLDVFDTPAGVKYLRFLEELIKSKKAHSAIINGLLPKQQFWTRYPHLVEMLIEQKVGSGVNLMIVRSLLAQPHWARHPRLLETIILLGDESLDELIEKHVLSRPEWARIPRFVELCGGTQVTVKCLRAGLQAGGGPRVTVLPAPPAVTPAAPTAPKSPVQPMRAKLSSEVELVQQLEDSPQQSVSKVKDQAGKFYTLKTRKPDQPAEAFVREQEAEARMRRKLREAGVPVAEVLEVDEDRMLSTWIEGKRADEWLAEWRARGAAMDDPAILALDRLLERAAERGLFLGNIRSNNLFWDGKRWAFAGATRAEGLEEGLSLQELLQRYERRMGQPNMTCLQSVLRILMAE